MESEDRVMSGLGHLAIFVPPFGFVAVLVLYFMRGAESATVAHHAKQALGWQIGAFIVNTLAGVLVFGGMIGGFGLGLAPGMHGIIPGMMMGFGLMAMVFFVINAAVMIFAVVAAIKAFQGERYRYPLIGDWVASV